MEGVQKEQWNCGGPCSWLISNPGLICACVTQGSLSSAVFWLGLEQLQASRSAKS